ncbi:Retrovirus-related Pol poly from transposon [Paramuricea clavata]|uniref:Retrovirus-related Pol poly from transposon, partial n=1 Tax=Paramuricea clavata TaxID=317549 RepID=A0A6S7K4W4_PARCT|nr:Retrovirus-related Pol poly from transposon [Paramuricea clavata]
MDYRTVVSYCIDNQSLTRNERKSVYEVLVRHPAVISGNKTDLGEGVEHSIDTGNAPSIPIPPRRLPFHNGETVRREVESLIESDVIEHSKSPWAAKVVFVKKKDGTERFCIDYRKLNEITKKDVYPLPRCEKILESLACAAYFSHLDLVRGYWQIKVAEKDREKTAFSTPDGYFQFKTMLFGLTNSPATFQRVMNTILAGLSWMDCLVSLDDIIVFGR